MAGKYTYPGVYIEEVPSGVKTIAGVATSITAFIGRAKRGPVNEPKTINNFGDFERIFGGLWVDSPMSYAVRDFYLNGGSQAVIVRLFHPTYATEAEQQEKWNQANTEAQAAADLVIQAANTAAGLAGATPTTVAEAALSAVPEEGVATEPAVKAAEAVAAAAVAEAERQIEAGESDVQLVVSVATNAVANAVEAAANEAAPIVKAGLSVNTLNLEAAYEGAWGNKLRARIDHDVVDEDANDLFNLSVWDGDAEVVETFRNVSVKLGHKRQVDKVLEQESKLVRVIGELPPSRPAPSGGDAKGVAPKGEEFSDDYSSGVLGEMASDGKVPTNDDYLGNEAKKQGIFAFEKADLFNLLCIPPYSLSQDVENIVLENAAVYCKKRRAMLLMDAPSSWNDKEDAKTGIVDVTKSRNAAIFFPRLKQPNPERDYQIEIFAPCGAVAGVFARTDSQRGVWKAPAGQEANLVGVKELSVPLTDAENGELNPLGINCLRAMPPAGLLVWGSRTLVGDDRLASEWKYIPVRRTALYIEESLYRGTQWVVFEPNDEPLWAQIRLNVGTFMHNLFRQGAFQGTTPKDAYFVKCDSETTTQADIDLGIVNILVGFAPLKPAEFVVIKISQMARKPGGE